MKLRTVLCGIGMHEFIAIPVKSYTLANGRQIIVTEGRCKFCGTKNDFS